MFFRGNGMPRNLATAYYLLQQPSNLWFWVKMPFCNSGSEATNLIMQNNVDIPWLTPDQKVIAIDTASLKLMQMLWVSKQPIPVTNTAFVGVVH